MNTSKTGSSRRARDYITVIEIGAQSKWKNTVRMAICELEDISLDTSQTDTENFVMVSNGCLKASVLLV